MGLLGFVFKAAKYFGILVALAFLSLLCALIPTMLLRLNPLMPEAMKTFGNYGAIACMFGGWAAVYTSHDLKYLKWAFLASFAPPGSALLLSIPLGYHHIVQDHLTFSDRSGQRSGYECPGDSLSEPVPFETPVCEVASVGIPAWVALEKHGQQGIIALGTELLRHGLHREGTDQWPSSIGETQNLWRFSTPTDAGITLNLVHVQPVPSVPDGQNAPVAGMWGDSVVKDRLDFVPIVRLRESRFRHNRSPGQDTPLYRRGVGSRQPYLT